MAIVDFDTECWDDPFFQSLGPLARYLFMYLWTNPHKNIAGLYIITMETISNDTRLSLKQIKALLEEASPKVKYDPVRSVCWVVKHVRRQFLRTGIISEQCKKGIRKAVLKLHYHPFFQEFIDEYPEIFDPKEKETLYRPSIDPLHTPYIPSVDPPGGGGGGGGGEGSALNTQNSKETLVKHSAKPENPVSPDVKSLIDLYHNTFKERFGQSPIIQGAKDGANVKKLLNRIPFDQLVNLLNKFFDSDDSFIMNSGYTLGVFYSQINKLIIGKRTARGKTFEAGDLWEKVKEQQDERKRSTQLQIPHDEGKGNPSQPNKLDR